MLSSKNAFRHLFAPRPATPLQELNRLAPSQLPRQKIADAEDFHDPRMKFIMRRILGLMPQIHCRAWEYARAFDLLASSGCLTPNARGIAFGAGREVLLYAVAAHCAHLTATDIYTADTDWGEARTEDASEFVRAGAPPALDPARLTALNMDARAISFGDASFDFAYSISSMEHFGDEADIVRHLREVRRILRPNACYVLTTELRLAGPTRRTIGNFAFGLEHLLDLIAQAGLHAEPVVDAGLAECRENIAHEDALVQGPELAQRLNQTIIWRELSGSISGPISLVLRRKGKGRPVVLHERRTHDWIRAQQSLQATIRCAEWRRLNPFGFLGDAGLRWAIPWQDGAGASAPQLIFGTTYSFYGDREIEVSLAVAAAPGDARVGELAVAVNGMAIDDPAIIEPATVLPGFPLAAGAVVTRSFRFLARRDRTYCIFGIRTGTDLPLLASIEVMVKGRP